MPSTTTTTATALLVIDIQRGAFDGARCPAIDSPERLVGNASRLVEAARAGGQVTIVFIQHSETTAGAVFEEGSAHWLLHELLVPIGPCETTLKKYASSAFDATDLDAQLKAQGIDALVICGLQSEFCVSNSVRSALQLGYQVTVAQDAHSTWPSQGRSAAEIGEEVNANLTQAGAELATTEALLAVAPQFKPALSSP